MTYTPDWIAQHNHEARKQRERRAAFRQRIEDRLLVFFYIPVCLIQLILWGVVLLLWWNGWGT